MTARKHERELSKPGPNFIWPRTKEVLKEIRNGTKSALADAGVLFTDLTECDPPVFFATNEDLNFGYKNDSPSVNFLRLSNFMNNDSGMHEEFMSLPNVLRSACNLITCKRCDIAVVIARLRDHRTADFCSCHHSKHRQKDQIQDVMDHSRGDADNLESGGRVTNFEFSDIKSPLLHLDTFDPDELISLLLMRYSNIEKCQDEDKDLAHCSSMFIVTSSRDFLDFLGQLYEEGVDLHCWKNISFKNVDFTAPVTFNANDERIVLQVTSTTNTEAIDVKVLHENRLCLKCTATKYVHEILQQDNSSSEGNLSADSRFVKANEFYETMAKYGYKHKGVFRSVREVHCTQRRGSVRLRHTHRLDALLDGALQAVVYSYRRGSGDNKHMLVPYHIDILTISEEAMTVGSEIVAEFDYVNKNISSCLTLYAKNIFVSMKGISFMVANFEAVGTTREHKGFSQHRNVHSQTDELRQNFGGGPVAEGMPPSMNAPYYNENHVEKKNVVGFTAERIAITSFACRLPSNINDLSEFWETLKVGRNVSTRIPCCRIKTRDDLLQGKYGDCIEKANFLEANIAEFEPEFFGISKSEAEKMDPQQRILLECVYGCMENAGLKSLENVGMFVGVMGAEYANTFDRHDDVISMLGSSASVLSGRLNYVFGSNAPSITIDTACSSSLVALNTAVGAILQKQCSKAIVAGVNLMLTEEGFGQRVNGRMLSEDGLCKAFDARADGYGRADGCVALLIEQVNVTIENSKRIWAWVDANMVNHAGRSVCLTAPNGISQQKLIKMCLACVHDSAAPSYWETHGTGTLLGDAVEMNALNATFKDMILGTAKTHIGHTEAAAGACALLKVALQMRHGYIPIHNHFMVSKNFITNQLRLAVTGEEWNGNHAGISCFGVSGTNAVAVLTKDTNINRKLQLQSRLYYIYPISSKSVASLKRLLAITREMLTECSAQILQLCSTAAFHRQHFRRRSAILLKKGQIQREICVANSPTQNLRFGIYFEMNGSNWLMDIIYLFHTYTKYYKRFIDIKQQLNDFLRRNALKKIFDNRDCLKIVHQCALILFLNDLGLQISSLKIDDDISLIASHLYKKRGKNESNPRSTPSPTNFSCVSGGPISKSLLTLLQMKILHKEHVDNTLEWIRLNDLIRSSGTICFEEKVAQWFVAGMDIRWENFYEYVDYENILPNYIFDKHEYWHSGRDQPFDHPLVGDIISSDSIEIVFRSQITSLNSPYLFGFLVNDEQHTPYGVCVEAILVAANHLSAGNFKKFRNIITHVSLSAHIMQQKFWMTTRVKKSHMMNVCTVELASTDGLIASGDVLYASASREVNTKRIKTGTIAAAKFYAELKVRRICFKNQLQLITEVSNDETVFKAVFPPQHSMRSLCDAMLQVLCYHNEITSENFYKHGRIIKQEIFDVNLWENMCNNHYFIQFSGTEVIAYSLEGILLASMSITEHIDKLHPFSTCVVESEKLSNAAIDEKMECMRYNSDALLTKIKAAVGEVLSTGITVDDSQLFVGFTDLGFDSLMITDLANRLRHKYFPALQISTIDIFEYPNINALSKLIHSRLVDENVSVKPNKPIRAHGISMHLNTMADASEIINKDSGIHSEVIGSSVPSYSERSSSEEDCVFVQSYFPVNTGIPRFLISLCDYRQGKRNAIIINSGSASESQYDEATNTWTAKMLDGSSIQKALTHLTDGKTEIAIQFDFHSKFPLEGMTTILLAFSSFVLKSSQMFVILSQPGTGQANAFAIGFSKSLAAENYPRIKFSWNFHLERLNIDDLRKKALDANSRQSENWLITGGLSGIGWQMALWLVENRDVCRIILLGRRPLQESKRSLLDVIRRKTEVLVASVDVASRSQMKCFFKKLNFKLTGVVHSAGATNDALASRQTREMFNKATSAKCVGLRLVSKMCDHYGHQPKYFIVNSSVSAILGNRGQCNYSAANALADEFMRERRAYGLPATTINWGNWLETGMALPVNERLRQVGFNGITISNAMRFLNFVIEVNPEQVIVADLNIDRIVQYRPDLAIVFEKLQVIDVSKSHSSFISNEPWRRSLPSDDMQSHHNASGAPSHPTACFNDCTFVDSERRESFILKSVVESLEMICETKITSDDYDTGFMDLGLDSLKAYRFISELQEKLACDLNILSIFENPTVSSLSQALRSTAMKLENNCAEKKQQTQDSASLTGQPTVFNNFGINIHAHSKKLAQGKILNFIERLMYSEEDILSIVRSQEMRFSKDENVTSSIFGKSRLQLIRNLLSKQVYLKDTPVNPVLCFVFTGQGSQIWNMGRQLYETFPLFKETLFMTLSLAQTYMSSNDPKLTAVLYEWNMRHFLFDTKYAQPIIFCFCYSLAKLFIHFGLEPNFLVGHSVGELVAFALSKMIDLSDTIRIVVERGKALSGISGEGKMLVVNRNAAKRLIRLTKVDVAAENGPSQIVLAGNNEEIGRCIHILHKNGYTSTLLDDRYAFHSSMITSKQLAQLEALCKNIPCKQLDRSYVASNLSGKLERRITASHILQHTQSTVRFCDCIKSLCDAGVNTWLEVGPGETLSTFIRGTTNDRSNTVLSSMKPKELEVESLIKALLELEKVGLNVIWSKVYPMQRTEPTLGNQIEYEKLISDIIIEDDNRLEGLDQHQFNALPLIPAAFSIFLFLLAASHQSNRERMAGLTVNLKNIVLRKPLHSLHDQELKIKMKDFEILLTANGLTCSECKYSRRIESRLELAIDEHFERNAQYFDHTGFYEGLRRKGLQYGPRLSVVRRIERVERKIVAELIGVKHFFVLIDAALQVLAAAVFEENDPHVYVPFEIEFIAVTCDETLLANNLKAIGQITERNERFICGDVDVSDSTGHLICALRNVTAIAKMSTNSGNRNALRHGRRRHAIKAVGESDIKVALPSKQGHPLTLSMHGTDKRRFNQCSEFVRASFPSTIMTTAKVESGSFGVHALIGVVGYAGQFSGLSCDSENLWNNLKTTTQITHSQERSNSMKAPYKVNLLNRQIEYFDAEFFGISPAEAIFIDPQQRLLLEMAQRTLENASLHQLPKNVGVFIAISSNDFAQKAYAEITEPNAYLAAGTNNSTLAGRIAYWLNVHGPALTIDTACSSFASALASACECIRGGLCEMALVGAANIILNPQSTCVLERAQMLSPKGICKVFDVDADGYIRSEGVGMVLIKKVNPQEHFRGVKIVAYAMGHNGRSAGLTVPNGRSQLELISAAIRQTNLGEISFVEAHATGTPIGDPIEVRAIREAFEKANLNPEVRLCSSKSQLGHCEAAAGVASFLTTLMSLENGYAVPNSHFMLRNDALMQNNTSMITSVFSVGEELNAKRTALMNCFGFSGSNVSLLLSKSESSAPEDGIRRIRHAQFEPYIMVISAHHPKSLLKMKADFVKYIEETDVTLADICAKLQLAKRHYRYRTAAILRNHCKELKFIANATDNKWIKIAFYFDEKPICAANIANLCENIVKFKKIFTQVYLKYSRLSNRNPIEKGADITLQFVAKLSLLIFLTQIGIYPTVICTRNDFDRIVAEVLLRKANIRRWCSAKAVSSTNSKNLYGKAVDPSNTWIKEKINEQISYDQYDCAIDVSRLLFYGGEADAENTVAASTRLANIIASLFVHGIDIIWDELNDLPCNKCRLPAYPLNEVELWPFHIAEKNSSVQTSPVIASSDGQSEDSNLPQSKRFLEEQISQKSTDFRTTEQHPDSSTEEVEKSNTADAFTEKRIETTTSKWLYELRYLKQALQGSSSRVKFIAINSAKYRQIFPKNCISSLNFKRNDDLMRLLSHEIRDRKCGNIVYEWKLMDDDLKNMAVQQSIILMQIWQTVDTSIKNNVISAACVNVYNEGMGTYLNGCAALLRSLAAERPSVSYRYIEIDKLDERFLDELSSAYSENEVISYKNGERHVQRLCPFVRRSMGCPKFDRIMITGGFGGIGKTVIKALKPKLAVILTRRTETDQLTKELIAECDGAVQIKVAKGDCGDAETVEKVLTEFTPLDMIFHCAGIVDNSLMENMSERKLQRVLHAKVDGVLNLLHIYKQCNVSKIVAFSSVAAIFGSAGQANYAFANGLMETLMAPNWNSLTISWGPWDEIGMLAGDEKKLIRKQITTNGWKFLPPTEAVNVLIENLNYTGHIVVLNASFERILSRQQHLSKFLRAITDVDVIAKIEVVPEKRKIPEERKASTYRGRFSRNILEDVIRRVSGIENIEPDVGFMSMGIDSLMIAQMKDILKHEINVDLATTVFYDRCTVDSLSAYIGEKVCERKEIQNGTYLSKVDSEQVAIIAYSGAFSGAANVDEFWKNLLAGKESITTENSVQEMNVSENFSRFVRAGGLIPDIDKFDHKFWSISHGDASYLDPQIRKFVEHAYFTLEKCGLVNRRKDLNIAVLAGAEPSTYGRMDAYRDGTIEKMFAINQKDFVAIWTSHLLDLHGPSFAVYSACSSGLLAVVQAADLLKSGRCDVALVGAASLVLPDAIGHYYQPGMIYSPDGHCRPFDVQSAGTVRGSAVGVVALRLLSEAIRDNNPILAVLEGYSVNNDGKMKSSFTAPNIDGQIECLKGAIASMNSGDVEYVECHGTGTEIGDSIELIAMSEAYTRELFIGSVKANIGHGFAGAGLAGLFKICKIAETRMIPMQINFNRFNDSHPETKFVVPKTNTCINREKFRVAVSSFGIGGTNVHLILRNIVAQKSKQLSNTKQLHLLPISAKTRSSCIALCRAIYEYLNAESDLFNVAYTLQNHREHFRYRVVIIAENVEDAKNQLCNVDQVLEANELTNDNIAFFFAPQGVQYVRMGEISLKGAPAFSKAMKDCCDIASREIGVDFWQVLYPKVSGSPNGTDNIDPTKQQCFAQCALFSLCFSIVQQLNEWGIQCATMIGHSVGEYSAAVCAGVFSLEEMMRILAYRSRLVASTRNAKMLALKNSPEQFPDGIEVSAVLGKHFKCVVGKPGRMDAFKELLIEEGIEYRELATEYGFHSSFMDSILPAFSNFLDTFTCRPPTKKILSNIDGRPIVWYDKDYMVSHMRKPVRLDKCISNLPPNIKVIIEIGPSDTTNLFYDGDVVVIIGGSGFIGRAFTNFLCKKFTSLIIILISRTANLQLNETESARVLQKWSTTKQHLFFIYDANIANKEDVSAVVKDILKQHSRINVVIHAAGKPTANKLQKNRDDVEAVFAAKIFGTRNVIDVLCENNCHVRNFILTSSLSAILGIQGNEDYAAANIFLDEMSNHSLYSVDNIVSIEWPAWNDSTMFTNYLSNSHYPVAQMIQGNSLSTQDYELIFFDAIRHVGCSAISTANPGDVIDEVIRIQEKPSAITSEDATIAKLEQSTEDVIKEIWKQCLGVENISLNDNFFHLGGHSLNGMQITWQVNKRFGCACTVNELFKNPNFVNFLAVIQRGLERNSITVCLPMSDENSTDVCLPMSDKLQRLKLTFAQENMFLLRNLYEPTLYNIVFSMKFEGNVNRRTLRYALLALIARQTSLRSVFITSEDEHYQECYSLTEAYQNIDWSVGLHDFDSTIQAETRFEFRLDMIPFRIIALETELGECYVIVSQHHIITDGWSMSVFAKELSEFYRSFTSSSAEISLRPPPLSRHIVDYATWQRNEQSLTKLEHDLKIVCNRLKDSRATRILKDRSISAGAFVNTEKYSFFLPPFLKRRLKEQIALLNTTEYVLMLSAFICLMRKYSDDFVTDEVVIGSVVSGRPFQEMNSIIGYFLNNIVIKVNGIKACAHTSEIIRAVEDAVNEARCFEHVPFHQIVGELGQQRNHNDNPLFEVYFNYRHNLDFPVVEIPDTRTTVCQHTSNTIFDFSCTIDETQKGLKITFDYNSSSYYSETIVELAKEYMRYIAEFDERQEDIPRVHRTGIFTQDVPGHYSMSTILVQQSNMSSSLIAIDDKQSTETYATLVKKASRIAFVLKQAYLQHQSEPIRADSIVPICMDPNKALIPIVAVLLTGAAYAPLDPENAVNWNAELLANINPACVISNLIDFSGYSVLNPDRIDPLVDRAQHRAHSSAEHLVYVIHTSGSTGKQKGVCVTHGNLVHIIRFATAQMQAHPEFRTYHSVNTVFDVSCMNIFTTLANAATLVTADNRLNAAFEIVEKRINFAYLPSALFGSFDSVQQANLESLERLFVGGESPSSSALNECLRRGVPIRQIYGPTETTIWSLTNRCTSYEGGDSGARVIGYPTGNQGILLVDKYGNELSGGKLAELVVTGDSVARGYLNIASPEFSDNHIRSREELILNRNGRRYRTGDMVRKVGAKLLFMGRIDCQCKIRGFRVDTTQIEEGIRMFDSAIKNVIVTATEDSNSLVAIIENYKIDAKILGGFLHKTLPYYMVPQIFISVNKLPLNASGKIDRHKLVKLVLKKKFEVKDKPDVENPKEMSPIEMKVADLWQELLQRPNIHLSDNFFDCGGHSLSALKLCNKLRQTLSIELKPTEIFTYPTISSLSELIEKRISFEEETISPLIPLRESPDSKMNLYAIHAIAGSIFPYYGILLAIPKRFNVFAIEYRKEYKSRTLVDLAHFYVRQINKERRGASVYLLGHSLGGILAREMAHLMQLQSAQHSPPFVVMLDSWSVGTENLQVGAVKEYLQQHCRVKARKHIHVKYVADNSSRLAFLCAQTTAFQEKHEPVCKKMSKSRRKVFDSGKQRATGSDVTINDVRNAQREREKLGGTYPRPKTSWREKHETFVSAVSASRQVDYALKTGTPLPPPPKTSLPKDYVQCEYCGRNFNTNAAERHIPFCRDQYERKGPVKVNAYAERPLLPKHNTVRFVLCIK
uniref:Fatty acid synthase n=3 Tax=Parascaris TaxID=6254 RepID=A0A914ZMZ4_PARUN